MPNHLPNLPPEVGGILFAIVVAILRVIYGKEETKLSRILLESLICGGLTLTVTSAIAAMGYDDQWMFFAGGSIGFMGSQFVRAIAMKVINKKAE